MMIATHFFFALDAMFNPVVRELQFVDETNYGKNYKIV